MLTAQILFASLTILGVAAPALAQQQDASRTLSGPQKIPPTLPTLYRHFLAYQLHLERKADELKQRGENGEDFRTHFQKVLGFSTPEFNKVHVAALDLEDKLAKNDKEIASAVTAFRASLPKQPFSESNPPPPPPAQLDALFKQRQAMIKDEIDTLHGNLSKDEVKKLEIFLQQDFSRSVAVNPAPPNRERMLLAPMPTRRAQ